jgi:hypothetical protein
MYVVLRLSTLLASSAAVLAVLTAVSLWGWGQRAEQDTALDALTYCTADMAGHVREIDAYLAHFDSVEAWVQKWFVGPTVDAP